jgi:hypothetical protein
MVDKEKIDTPNTQIHECSVPWLDTDTLKIVLSIHFDIAPCNLQAGVVVDRSRR